MPSTLTILASKLFYCAKISWMVGFSYYIYVVTSEKKTDSDIVSNQEKFIPFTINMIMYVFRNKEDREELFVNMFDMLFNALLDDLKNKAGRITNFHLQGMNKKYLKETSPERIVINYMAGMTDDYFMTEYKLHFLPKRKDLTV
jgi:dGTP triphosphohydrolase